MKHFGAFLRISIDASSDRHNASMWRTLIQQAVMTIGEISNVVVHVEDVRSPFPKDITCDRCVSDACVQEIEHTCEPPDGTEFRDTTNVGRSGDYGYEIERVRLAEQAPVLNYFTWEVFLGKAEARDLVAEGFADTQEQAQRCIDAVIGARTEK